jgi:hypothetical protein
MSTAPSLRRSVERGERRVDLIQFLDFADALDFDASKAIKKIAGVQSR